MKHTVEIHISLTKSGSWYTPAVGPNVFDLTPAQVLNLAGRLKTIWDAKPQVITSEAGVTIKYTFSL